MQAAIYLRQSEDRNGNMLAVDRQRQDCEKLCAQKGWTTTEYMDNDTSATSGKSRPAYQAMLADIRVGAIDAVVAWDLDRLYRQPRELEDLIDVVASPDDSRRESHIFELRPVQPDELHPIAES